MDAHGNYTIEVTHNIVHSFPTGGFNEQGIKEMFREILSVAPKEMPWALFEHPRDIAGLTPEAVNEIFRAYQTLSQHNCIAIGLELSLTWQAVFENKIVGKVDIPVYLGSDPVELEQLVTQRLNQA